MKNYVDTATYEVLSGGGYDPETGEDGSGVPETITLKGRYDANIGNSVSRSADALSFKPAFVFYMPLGQPNIPIETILSVLDVSSGITFSGKVKMFNKGIFNAYVVCSNS